MVAYVGCQDTDLAAAGYGTASVATSDPQRRLDAAAFQYTANSGEAVTYLGIGGGSSTGGQFEVGVYDVTSNTLIGSATITQNAASNAWQNTAVGPWNLTVGHVYEVAWRAVSATKTAIKSSTNSGHNHATLTGTSALPATWSDGASFGSKFAVRATVEVVNPSITSVSTDNIAAQGDTDAAVAGANLSAIDGATLSWTNTSVTSTLSVNTVTATSFNVSTVDIGNGFYTDSNHVCTFAATTSGVSQATKTLTVNPATGYVTKIVSEGTKNTSPTESALANITLSSYSQVELPSAVVSEGSSRAITWETSGGEWTGRLSFDSYIPPVGLEIPWRLHQGDASSWTSMLIHITAQGIIGLTRDLARELSRELARDISG